MAVTFRTPLRLLPLTILVAAFLLVYGRLLVDLSTTWTIDGNYSHGFLILPVVGYLVWNRRRDLAATERRPTIFGLLIVVGSLVVLLVATAGVEFFLMRISAIGVAVGIVLFLAGWPWLRLLLFPLGLSLMLIPLMLIVDQPWTLPFPSLPTLGALVGLALMSTALGYVLYFRILATAGATNLLLVTLLIPVSAILLGILVLGETLQFKHVVGMGLIGAGLAAIDGRPWQAFWRRLSLARTKRRLMQI